MQDPFGLIPKISKITAYCRYCNIPTLHLYEGRLLPLTYVEDKRYSKYLDKFLFTCTNKKCTRSTITIDKKQLEELVNER